MKEIAIYGKGGIGKSTICANISASLSLNNKNILQIGCDPKHDSTRLLMRGKNITTVLDYIKVTNPLEYNLNDILFKGFNEISCIEAGGPEPGVGCAGRGILTTFELLDRLGIKKNNYDFIMYDVLGDVVCGGFAVPIRKEYADVIYIVTSGEYMSLYAANNILRGIKNFDFDKKRVAGLIFNKRGIKDEDKRIENFSKAVDLPICAVFPRSDEFSLSEKKGITLVENYTSSHIKDKFINLSKTMINNIELHEAKPLSDSKLEEIVLDRKIYESNKTNTEEISEIKETRSEINKNEDVDLKNPNAFLSKNVISKEPLHGCAFNGAITMSVHVKDAVVIGHSPKSCCHISYQSISSAGRRNLFERGSLLPVPISPNLVCSNMDESSMVFGGIDLLKEKIHNIKKYNPKAIIVVSSCPSGIIGDDLTQIENLSLDLPIIHIDADGNLAGDYMQGMIMSYMNIAKSLIKKDVKPIPNTVNIIFEKVVAKNTSKNFETINKMLNTLGITVNCRYLCETSVEKIQNFKSAQLNLLANKDYMGRMMEKFFIKEYNAKFLDVPFPIGFSETKNWLNKVAAFFNKEDLVNNILSVNEKIYKEEIERIKPYLKDKKLMIVTYNHSIDWIIETALSLEMDIVKVGILNFSQDNLFITKFKNRFNVEENYDQNNRLNDIKTLNPDIILSNYTSSNLDKDVFADTIPHCPDVGFFSGLDLAKRWAKLFKLNIKEGWRKDEILFKKYYSR
ncbi:nitrogenase component 1 [Tepidibacter hydrothermalis]|uniref:nitrogenase n=1 Tax=Tepidibacter hydrothermalis TaxID=3036126 RepID=A0ABY8EFS7_9FIRM|nr:nitrogenase component 1 [Tepidibacter hydrothermalis]WFD10705.1 nitrogenase component 1 [Tepidibacter hydrothermalis]